MECFSEAREREREKEHLTRGILTAGHSCALSVRDSRQANHSPSINSEYDSHNLGFTIGIGLDSRANTTGTQANLFKETNTKIPYQCECKNVG